MQQTKTLHNNFPVDTDAYKITHHLGYRRGLENLYSYGECRLGAKFSHVIPFGYQVHFWQSLVGQVVTPQLIEEAQDLSHSWFGHPYFNTDMWKYIINKHGGMLPIRIKAVPEGTRMPINNVMFTIEVLDNKCVPVVNHCETELSHSWYPTTIASNSFEIKKDIYKRLVKTGTPEMIEYMCHDFGYRGTTCPQQAERGGMAHMINFRGSDTTRADRALRFYYGIAGKSILQTVFATEHSVAEQFGGGEGEYDYVHNVLDKLPDGAIGSVVIDTYNALNFIDNVITRPDIKERILARNGKIVWRPDTGNPEEISNRIINSLGHNFGYTFNDKSYKILNPKIGLIWGDGMDRKTIDSLHGSLNDNKWSSDNMVVGSGGGLLQKGFDRDTNRFAIKASYGVIDGNPVNMMKNPATDKSKKSKTGMLKLHEANGKFSTLSSASETAPMFNSYIDTMDTVLEMGQIVKEHTFDEIRKRADDAFHASLKEDAMLEAESA